MREGQSSQQIGRKDPSNHRLSRRSSAAPTRVPELKTAPHALMRLRPSLMRQPAAAWPCCCGLARLGVVSDGTGWATG
jgi:hypothetical protein